MSLELFPLKSFIYSFCDSSTGFVFSGLVEKSGNSYQIAIRCYQIPTKLSPSCYQITVKLSPNYHKITTKLPSDCHQIATSFSLSCHQIANRLPPDCYQIAVKNCYHKIAPMKLLPCHQNITILATNF